MSLKNVLETARKLGIPVVVTDEAGEAAQVVMPFDDFAAMVGATTPVSRKPRLNTESASTRVTRVPIKREEEEMNRIFADLDRADAKGEKPLSIDDLNRLSESEPSDDPTAEEKFYLEPVDDEDPLK